eukprot:766544-Hanusia_phi.AAC.9
MLLSAQHGGRYLSDPDAPVVDEKKIARWAEMHEELKVLTRFSLSTPACHMLSRSMAVSTRATG